MMIPRKRDPWITCSGIAFGLALLPGLGCSTLPEPTDERPIRHVIHISVDGLRADALSALGPAQAPNLARLCLTEGAHTDNARTDPIIATSLPNHTSQLTSRSVFGDAGHGWFINDDIKQLATLHQLKKAYVSGVFDVVHDAGLSTALYANKGKFSLFEISWSQNHGTNDQTGADNGRGKIDRYLYQDDMAKLVSAFLREMPSAHYNYTFIHLRQPDTIGHRFRWDISSNSAYLGAVIDVDHQLGRIVQLVSQNPGLKARTAIILTSDHGGERDTDYHLLIADAGLVDSGIIPFCIWGPGVAAGADLYALNPTTRRDPGRSIPLLSAPIQPIRNADAANLALDLLNLPPIPGSNINYSQDLTTR